MSMKKLFTFVIAAMAMLSANAETVTTNHNLELTGSNIKLPTVYLTGEAVFSEFKNWGEVRFFDKEQSSGYDAYEIYAEDYPVLHLEFESLTEDLQIHIKCGSVEKYQELTPDQLVYDIKFDQYSMDLSNPITHLGLQKRNVTVTAEAKIKKCVLLDEDEEEALTLYYVNNNSGGWGVKLTGTAKCLSGKVSFIGNWGQLGGEAWAPADILKDATYAKYTFTFTNPVQAAEVVDKDDKPLNFQVVSTADKARYHTIEPGSTQFVLETNPDEKAYAPHNPAAIQKMTLQIGGSGAVFPTDVNECPYLEIKSVVLTVETVETGITTVKSYDITDRIFNIAGQQVGNNTKGLVIVNGKKVIK